MKKYTLTDEHKAQLKPWADKWIANGLSTKPMDDNDRAEMRKAIKGLYEAANLTPPPDHGIVFVPSPFVARFAGGFAASIWWKRKNKTAATHAATRAATRAATDAATRAATDDATRAATDDATYDATRAATRAATHAATRAATRAATDAAIDDAKNNKEYTNKNWYTDTSGFADAGLKLGVGKFGFSCAEQSWRMYQGGNFWSGWVAFLSFFRHIAKLPLDYSKFEHWEKATIHGSYRIMHPNFCMVSDRPRVLKLDDQGRPHCETGPYIQWSDGTGMYCWHGVRVPAYWIEQKHLLTAKDALTWENLEQRRAACEIVGWEKILKELNAKTIDKDEDPQIGELLEVDLPDSGKEKFIRVQCGTGRVFAIPVPPDMKTALQANSWTYGIEDWQGYKVEVRT